MGYISPTFNTELRNGMVDAMAAIFDGGVVEVNSGSQSLNTPSTAANLVTVTIPATGWGASSNGSKPKDGTWSAVISNSGKMGHIRVLNSAGTAIFTARAGVLLNDVEFSANTTTNEFTIASTELSNNDPIRFTGDGDAPTPLVMGRVYYVINHTGGVFQLASSPSGSALNISDTGSATARISSLMPFRSENPNLVQDGTLTITEFTLTQPISGE